MTSRHFSQTAKDQQKTKDPSSGHKKSTSRSNTSKLALVGLLRIDRLRSHTRLHLGLLVSLLLFQHCGTAFSLFQMIPPKNSISMSIERLLFHDTQPAALPHQPLLFPLLFRLHEPRHPHDTHRTENPQNRRKKNWAFHGSFLQKRGTDRALLWRLEDENRLLHHFLPFLGTKRTTFSTAQHVFLCVFFAFHDFHRGADGFL